MRTGTTVADVMTTDVVSVRVGTTFKSIAGLLAEKSVSAVPVVDIEGRPLGVVSETDLLRKEQFQVAGRPRWYDRKGRRQWAKGMGTLAIDLMTGPAVTVGPRASLQAAAETMADAGVTRLVVVDDDGRTVGIVSRSDLLRVFLASDNDVAASVRRQVLGDILRDAPHTVQVSVTAGVVTLRGQLERRSAIPFVVDQIRAVDGVVDVVDGLTYRIDDVERRVSAYIGRQT